MLPPLRRRRIRCHAAIDADAIIAATVAMPLMPLTRAFFRRFDFRYCCYAADMPLFDAACCCHADADATMLICRCLRFIRYTRVY